MGFSIVFLSFIKIIYKVAIKDWKNPCKDDEMFVNKNPSMTKQAHCIVEGELKLTVAWSCLLATMTNI